MALGRPTAAAGEAALPLDVCKLVCSQQAAAKLCVLAHWEWVGLYQVGNEADCRLWQGMQVMLCSTICTGEPGPLVHGPEQRKFDCSIRGGPQLEASPIAPFCCEL
jgi:hypothetical protein